MQIPSPLDDMLRPHAVAERRYATLFIFVLMVGMLSPLGERGSMAAKGADATPPPQPTSGPGGREYRYDTVERRRAGTSPAGAFVFTPAGAENDEAALPLVIFVHGFTAVDPEVYDGWIEHLVRRGAVVVYPDYQSANLLSGTQQAYLGDMMAGIREALLALNRHAASAAPVVVVGHSLGGILAVNYAALAADAGFPTPDVLMAVEPGGCRNCGEGSGFGVALPIEPSFPQGLEATVVVGDDDTVVAEGDARRIWDLLEDDLEETRAHVRIFSDRHGEPALVADHHVPLTSSPGTLNALDWNGVWRLLDAQVACAAPDAACDTVFGDEDIADMGQWSDGEPVRPLEIDAPSPPPR